MKDEQLAAGSGVFESSTERSEPQLAPWACGRKLNALVWSILIQWVCGVAEK